MANPKKKQFPGIFVIIAISFLVYLTVVTVIIMVHYGKSGGDSKSNKQVAAQK